ncbi:mRNA surveillance protein pelota [Candidatus Woesearchaeota archaeon]|nr:mRNA surveillance protein pelota [Candidatus Woesearchaeota archaeon]
MKKISINYQKGNVKIHTENKDDLWYLSQIIDPNDLVKGKTYRKIKLGGDGDKSKIIKKPVTLEISSEKVDFNEDSLRVNGKVHNDVEDIPKGSYHAINIDTNSIIEITKRKWLSFQKEKLEKALSQNKNKFLIVSLDRERAIFAITKDDNYDTLSEMNGEVQKKEDKASFTGDFYKDTIKQIQEYDERFKPTNIILGSPAFWKDDLYKKISDEKLKKKIVLTTCFSHGKNSIHEILKGKETQELLKQEFLVKELHLVSELLEKISKNDAYAYGFAEVNECANLGAVKTLLVTDNTIKEYREIDRFNELEFLMNLTEEMNGEVHVINSSNDAGRKLDGLTGIGAILRYKVNN